MVTGELKSQVDKIWETFWTGGISNPLTVIEQFTFLLFLRRLDENQLRSEKQANFSDTPLKNPLYSAAQNKFRWSQFKQLDPETIRSSGTNDCTASKSPIYSAATRLAKPMRLK